MSIESGSDRNPYGAISPLVNSFELEEPSFFTKIEYKVTLVACTVLFALCVGKQVAEKSFFSKFLGFELLLAYGFVHLEFYEKLEHKHFLSIMGVALIILGIQWTHWDFAGIAWYQPWPSNPIWQLSFSLFYLAEWIFSFPKDNSVNYQDFENNDRIRSDLKENKIDIIEFIKNHGWSNIKKWGLDRPEEDHSITTKEVFFEKLLKHLESKNFSNFFSQLQEHKLRVCINEEYIELRFYRLDRPILSNGFKSSGFTESTLEQKREEISKVVGTYYTCLPGVEILANWSLFKKLENDLKLPEKVVKWGDDNRDDFEQIHIMYTTYICFILSFCYYNVKNPYPLYLLNSDKHQKMFEELNLSYEKYWGWYPKQYLPLSLLMKRCSLKDLENDLKELNRWYMEKTKNFNESFNLIIDAK